MRIHKIEDAWKNMGTAYEAIPMNEWESYYLLQRQKNKNLTFCFTFTILLLFFVWLFTFIITVQIIREATGFNLWGF